MNEHEVLEELEDTQRGRFLTFDLEEEVYGIEIRFVKEIIGMQPITKLPDVPDNIKGVINLRGKIIPLVDMRLKLKKPAMEYTDRTCILVIDTQEISAGLIVDEVSEVITIDDKDISPPPSCGSGANCRYLSGVGKAGGEVKLLLDCEALFNTEETDQIRSAAQAAE